MRAVGLKILKNRLSEYVRLAAGGETVLVTDRDRVVAELVPPRTAQPSDALLADAVRQGIIRPATDRSGTPPPRDPVTTFEALMEELNEDRSR